MQSKVNKKQSQTELIVDRLVHLFYANIKRNNILSLMQSKVKRRSMTQAKIWSVVLTVS